MYLFRSILQFLEENYFSASLNNNYEYLNFTSTASLLLILVGGLCVGMIIASVAAVLQKRTVGRFVRALITKEALHQDSALTLAELGLKNSGLIKYELSRPSVVRKLIGIVEGDAVYTYQDELSAAFSSDDALSENNEPTPKKSKNFTLFAPAFKVKKPDFSTARFFIPEEFKYRAEIRFQEKGSSWWVVLLSVVLFIALFFVALRFIPALVNMLDLTIGNLSGQ